ncbi:MAG: polyprenol monophosphomannose synthase [Chitinophagales bacterium]|nr:polyprenol monophosphomannose synthase [Chitinophagales bacterium]
MSRVLVIIPTYNEIENISLIIQAIHELPHPFDILIIDDNSPDGTSLKVKEIQKSEPYVYLLERSGKLGLGTAYILGFRWAIEQQYDYIFEMDADFSHDPNALIPLLNACKDGADMSVGSRYIRGGKVVNWPKNRILMSYFASIYVRIITWLPVADTTGGFVCYKRATLEGINLDRISFVGYAFQIEMKYAVWSSGFKIKEVPITFKDRILGLSKMSTKIFKEAFWGVLQIRKNTLFSRNYYKTLKK